jgi:superoxide reductase
MAEYRTTTEQNLGELLQTADWKSEKHVPLIECPDKVKKGEYVKVNVTVGKEIAHPNKTEHHICWIRLFFHPDGEKFPYQIGDCQFWAHGASVNGPDTSSVYTNPTTTLSFKTDRPGTLHAVSYCNVHGLWSYMKKLDIG